MTRILILSLLSSLLLSCDSIKVVYDYDKNIDFQEYKTIQFYGWQENSDRILSKFDKERIENAVSLQFRKRGHTMVKDNADLIVSLYVVSETQTKKTATTTYVGGMGPYYGYGPGWAWGPTYSTTTIDEHKYKVGTLIISVYDAAKKELVWEGVAQGSIDDNPAIREAGINRAIDKIMFYYPVKVKK